MKLELKHIAHYLPYGLRIQSKIENSIDLPYSNCDIVSVDMLSKSLTIRHFVGINEDEEYITYKNFSDIKLILRPLSDLQNKELDYWIEFSNKIDEMNTEYLIEALVNKTFYAKDLHFSFKVQDALFELHFDVFGLIPQGLAIDINTI